MSGNGRQMCPCQCHWDLSWLRFGDTRIAVTDVDGMFLVERFGHFLFIETKRREEPMTKGQEIMLCALSKIERFTVVVLFGDHGEPEFMRRVRRGEFEGIQETNREDFQRRVDEWFGQANQFQFQLRLRQSANV